MKSSLALLTALGFCTATQSHAASIAILNFGFENSAGFNVADDGFSTTSSWQGQTANLGNTQVKNDTRTGKEGNNYYSHSLNAGNSGNDGSGVVDNGFLYSGTLGTFSANTIYTLTVAMANQNADRTSYIGLATGITAATLTGQTTLSTATSSLVDFTYILNTADNTGVVGQDIRIFLGQTTTVNSQFNRESYFDNVRLDSAAIPEPSGVALLSLGAVGLLVRRRA